MRQIIARMLHLYRLFMVYLLKLPPLGCGGDFWYNIKSISGKGGDFCWKVWVSFRHLCAPSVASHRSHLAALGATAPPIWKPRLPEKASRFLDRSKRMTQGTFWKSPCRRYWSLWCPRFAKESSFLFVWNVHRYSKRKASHEGLNNPQMDDSP